MEHGDLLIVGVGNPDRGDDGAGPAVIRHLKTRLQREGAAEGVGLVENWGEATALVAALEGWRTAVLVDAAQSGAEPGTYRCFEASEGALPSGLAEVSSHGFGVAQAVELARALGTLPGRCVVYAIEGESFEAGAALSPAVARAAETVGGEIVETFIAGRPQPRDRQRHA